MSFWIPNQVNQYKLIYFNPHLINLCIEKDSKQKRSLISYQTLNNFKQELLHYDYSDFRSISKKKFRPILEYFIMFKTGNKGIELVDPIIEFITSDESYNKIDLTKLFLFIDFYQYYEIKYKSPIQSNFHCF